MPGPLPPLPSNTSTALGPPGLPTRCSGDISTGRTERGRGVTALELICGRMSVRSGVPLLVGEKAAEGDNGTASLLALPGEPAKNATGAAVASVGLLYDA